jgi:hypothetical protein
LAIYSQLVDEPWAFYSFVLRSMRGGLTAVLAPFPLVEIDAHIRISEVLEVEQHRIVKVKGESDAILVVQRF